MATNKDPLVNRSETLDKLYDAEAMMLMKATVADGYIVLLGGGRAKNSGNNNDIALQFMALTQGNVLDACFGVVNPTRREDTPASRASKAAKEMLADCATTDKFEETAVEAYCDAFQVIVEYRNKLDKMNCIVKCFKAGKLRKKTERNLVTSFSDLAKAVAEAS